MALWGHLAVQKQRKHFLRQNLPLKKEKKRRGFFLVALVKGNVSDL